MSRTRRGCSGPRAAALLAALAAAAGCATVRRAREAQDAARAPAGERTVTAAEAQLGPGTTLALPRAVALARAYQPSVTRARRQCDAAAAQVRQAQSAAGPAVDASGGYTLRTSNTARDHGHADPDGSASAALSLDLLLADFGRTSAAVRQAVARHVAAEQALRGAENDAAYAVRSAFYDLCKAVELERVAAEGVRRFAEHLEQVRAFAEVGTRIRYDVTKAEVDLGNAQLSLIDARRTAATARAALNQSLGLADSPEYAVEPGAEPGVDGDTAALMAVARQRHPDLRASRARELVASAAVDAAIAEFYPSLRLRAGLDWSGGSLPLVANASSALQAALALLDSGRRDARIEEAVASLRAARAETADAEQRIHLELSRAVSARDTARERLALTELLVREARESLGLVQERYRVGKASAVEVTDAQVALIGAQADQVRSRFDLEAAAAQILHAIGGEYP